MDSYLASSLRPAHRPGVRLGRGVRRLLCPAPRRGARPDPVDHRQALSGRRRRRPALPRRRSILADDRAVCMARYYLEANLERLDEIPAAAERVQLVEIGNHCRGTVFLDGRRTSDARARGGDRDPRPRRRGLSFRALRPARAFGRPLPRRTRPEGPRAQRRHLGGDPYLRPGSEPPGGLSHALRAMAARLRDRRRERRAGRLADGRARTLPAAAQSTRPLC